jgi:hypothetical protein
MDERVKKHELYKNEAFKFAYDAIVSHAEGAWLTPPDDFQTDRNG